MVKINEKEIRMLCRYAIDEYPNECCGILLGSKKQRRVQKVYRAANAASAERQKLHFLINPLELYRVEKEAAKSHMEIVGFYHSHADHPAVLSEEDQEFMIQDCLYMVVSVAKGTCKEIRCFMRANGSDGEYERKTAADWR